MAKSKSIPLGVQRALEERLEKHARDNWKEQCRSIVVRFRGEYAYVEAFPSKQWYPPGITEEQRAQIDATPMHLCRLGFLGGVDRWAFFFFKYSTEKYERSFTMSGSMVATPEEAFDSSAFAYLQG